MHKRTLLVAVAAMAAFGLLSAPALAQSPDPAHSSAAQPPAHETPTAPNTPPSTTPDRASSSDPTTSPTTGSATAPSAGAAASDVSVTTGMSVKDNMGAVIGTVTDVKTGADGKMTATIRMGADTFAVETSSLAVSFSPPFFAPCRLAPGPWTAPHSGRARARGGPRPSGRSA